MKSKLLKWFNSSDSSQSSLDQDNEELNKYWIAFERTLKNFKEISKTTKEGCDRTQIINKVMQFLSNNSLLITFSIFYLYLLLYIIIFYSSPNLKID